MPDTEFQRRNINALNHTEISEDAHRVLKDFGGVAKKVRIAGRVLLVAGAALDVLELGDTIVADLHDAEEHLYVCRQHRRRFGRGCPWAVHRGYYLYGELDMGLIKLLWDLYYFPRHHEFTLSPDDWPPV